MIKIHQIIAILVCISLIGPVYAIQPDNKEKFKDLDNKKNKIPVIITFKNNANSGDLQALAEQDSIIKEKGGKINYKFHIINGVAAELPESAIEALSKHKDIEFIELDSIVYALDQETSWGVTKVKALDVHPITKGSGIKIAVIDSGIDYNHPDLKDNYRGGYDFVNSDNDPKDDYGHGTKCAGVIASIDNSYGVLGVAPESSIYSLKVLGSDGMGYSSRTIRAIEWAVDHDIDIISMSLGGSTGSDTYRQAVDNAYNAGVLLVASAGNSGSSASDNVKYPAKFDSVIAVSATTQSDYIASFSSVGPAVELAAPGYYIRTTTMGSGYASFSGTSAAAPFVSGVAALMMAANPTMTNAEIRDLMHQNAIDLGESGRDIKYGYGLTQAIVDQPASLNVNIQTGADPIDSGQSTQVTVHVENGGIPINGVAVDISTLGGNLASSTGSTDTNGNFVTTYTAPQVTAQAQSSISVIATKPGYMGANDVKIITINPQYSTPPTPQLQATLTSSTQTLEPGQQTQLTIHVTADTAPIANSLVSLSTQGGILDVTAGTTDANGNFVTTYTAPLVASRTQFSISATVSKTGYVSGLDSTIITINPTTLTSTTLPESPHPYPNSYDKTWTIKEPGATQIRIHFSSLKTEARYDFVYIYDMNNVRIASYSGYYYGHWTPWVDGDTITVRLKTDSTGIRDGFIVDSKETVNTMSSLDTVLTVSPSAVTSGENAEVTVHVTSGATSVSGATVVVSDNGGSLNPISGTTDANGNFVITYTAPQVTTQSQFIISATTTKVGYSTGTSSGTITVNPVSHVITTLPESPHPYPNSYDKTWTITEPGATQIRIHFSSLKTEARYDFVYIYDINNVRIASYSGYYYGHWTPWVDGDTIKVRLKTDSTGIRDGFVVDNMESRNT